MMPGKVNPVIPEFLIQLGFKAAGTTRHARWHSTTVSWT